MNTDLNASNLQKERAIMNIRNELHKLYREKTGKEPDPEILRAEAEDFVARFGPQASLKEFF